MKLTAKVLIALFVASQAVGSLSSRPEGAAHRVSVQEADGELWCSIHAERASLRDLILEVAAAAKLQVEGFDQISRTAYVTVDLRHRPLRQALTYVAGSVGLRVDHRVGSLILSDGSRGRKQVTEMREAALVEYLRALRAFPGHEAAAEAELSQASIEERRGNLTAARTHYELLVEQFPDSEYVPQALFDSGRLLARQSEWAHAAQKFSELLRLEQEHDLEVPARTALARCAAQLGDPGRALHMLEALDEIDPQPGAARLQSRLYVRARALIGVDRHRRALAVLAQADTLGREPAMRRESLELRARAFEADGAPADAARAWLGYCDVTEGNDRRNGLREAARLALEAGDDLGVVFIGQLAKASAGVDESGDIERLTRQARERLSLDDTVRPGGSSRQRLLRAERLLTAGMVNEALELLEGVASSVEQFDEEDATRFVLAYGRALAHVVGPEAAVLVFRDGLTRIENEERRRRIYLLAGELLERHDLLEEAAEAYRGRL